MAAYDFPNNPTIGDRVVIGNQTREWNGSVWALVPTIIAGPIGYSGSQGTIGYVGSQGYTGSQGAYGTTGYTGSQGIIGYTGSQGVIGYTGSQGIQGIIGYTGSKGDTGLGFSIAKSYISVAALLADTSPTGIISGQFAIIETASVENPENSRLYLWNGSVYSYVTDLSGAQGITGPQGIIGYTGSNGYTGSQGVIGYTGSKGYTGSQGVIGYTGSQGVIGYTGSQGIQGNIGYTGSQGIQGNIGYTGSQGIQGIIGYTGSQGVIGYTGSQGIQGNIGYTGSQGIQGNIGYTGSQGTQGNIGYTGSQGSQGVIGYTGSQGIQGNIGYTGSQGIIGYTGSQGIQGNIGYTGSQGIIGYTGSKGDAGPSNIINSTSDTTTTVLYPVMVDTIGSPVTAKSNSTALIVNASNGNIGINNTAPTAKLDVHGNVRFTNSTTNTKVAGPTYNYNWFNSNGILQSYKIATLPISSGSTLEHIVIEGVLGGWVSTDKNNFKLNAANRTSLAVNYQSGTGYSTRPPQAHVDFYTEADGSVSVWVVLDANTYSIASVNITVAYGTPELLTYPNPTSATPTGTLSYSTKTGIPAIYTTNSSQIGIGMTAPVAKLDIGGTSAGLPSARFATNAGGGSVQNAAGLSAYWNLSNGSSESTLAYGNSVNSYFSMGEHNGTAYTERLRITNAGSLGIGTTAPTNKLDVAGNASLRNSTTATNFYAHNTYTDASNYERAKIGWNTNVLEIGSEALGTGIVRNINLIGGNVGIGAASPSAKLDVVGDIEINSNVNLNSEATTLATTTKTQISSFAVASFRSGKLIVQAYDSVTGEVQISELLVVHNGTTASATEYGVVYTGAASLVSYDVDISAGNVRLMATRTSANSTQYKISKTVIVA